MKYELVDPMTLIDPADMINPVDLLRARLSGQLERPTEPKRFCKAQTRSMRTGFVVNTCTLHVGHVAQDGTPNAHVDHHTAAVWMDS